MYLFHREAACEDAPNEPTKYPAIKEIIIAIITRGFMKVASFVGIGDCWVLE